MPRNVISVLWDSDSRQIEGDFDKVQAKTVGVGAAVGTFAGNLAYDLGSRALDAVKSFADDSARAYSDLEQAVGGTNAVFGENASVIEDASKRAADAIGLSEAEFRTMTTRIGGQLKRMTGDIDYAADRSIFLTEVGADLAATYGGTTVEAVEALSAAFRREADPAERFNLDLRVSAVNAKAVELGLADTKTAVDDYAYAQALVALITEQSADAQGQFGREMDTIAGKAQRANAELENQKAIVGEVWAPIKQEAESGFWRALGGMLAEVSTEIQMLTGNLTEGAAALQEFQAKTGEYVDTAAEAVQVSADYSVRLAEVVDAAGLSVEELQKLRDMDAEVLEGMGHTSEEIEHLAEVVDQHLGKAMSETADQVLTGKYRPAVEDTTEATADLGEESISAADAIRAIGQAASDAVDPVFSYYNAQADLASAQQAYNDAVEEFGENSPQAIEAAGRIADANGRILDAVTDIGEKGVPAAMEALKTMGVPQAVIDGFAADRDRIEEIFDNLVLRVGVSVPSLHPTTPRSGGIGWESETRTHFARGGIARATPGGVDATIAEAGEDEVVSPLDQLLGMIRDTVAAAMPASGSGSVTLQVGASRSQPVDGWEIIEALQRVEQTYGPIPITVTGA